MPRKTKETKEMSNIVVPVETTDDTKKTSRKTTTKSVAKKPATKTESKSKNTKSKSVAKKTPTTTTKVATKKTSPDKKTTSKKETTKSVAKKTVTSKNKTTKASSSTKTTNKKATTTKTTTKKTSTKTETNKTATKKSTTSKRKSSTTKKQKVEIVEYYDLPYRYNQTVVKVLAQTPNNLFIYWDISDKDRENYKLQYGEDFFETTKPVLIIHNTTMNYTFEIDINDFANSWYLHVNDAKCDYKIELGRRPIKEISKINTDYIYISTSNNIASPNDHILFDKTQNVVYFKNVKTGAQTTKTISSNPTFIKNMGKIYNIYDIYKALYQNEDIEEIYDLSNPSSGNPSSGSLSSKFK